MKILEGEAEVESLVIATMSRIQLSEETLQKSSVTTTCLLLCLQTKKLCSTDYLHFINTACSS
jgi:hypothetical protein